MGSSVTPPLFFISYAHDPFGDDDQHVDRFYRDLNHDVLMFAGSRDETAGFCDASLRLGQRWSRTLVDNLSTAQVFIPILSPKYFQSEACGKEWSVFASRLDEDARPESQDSSIIPLLWIPMTVPAIAQPYQFKETSFGAKYEEVKLRALIREGRHGDDYKSFVQKLAQRVFQHATAVPVAATAARPGFDEILSAFTSMPAPRPSAGNGAAKVRHSNRRSSSLVDRPILNANLPEDPR
ncbi:hypothetical protein GCM10010172_15780 [Paractinoplanes ferrugineus]|uniref:TIR domain-containing protein n=1 Tax=Paractinoplanes ferrugineus TaxID=113564 RepID=A0A919MJG8_9ACTN|nr:hypothetical protein Afe05nite_19820 [Actinoplanes ferrugineus]